MMTDNIEILVKLFETLKTSVDKNEDATKQLIIQQLELVSHIKSLPVNDLREALKEHAKESAKEINACTEVVSVTNSDVMSLLRSISGKLTKLFVVIGLIITISTTGYFIIRAVSDSDTIIEKHLDEKFKELSDQISKERNEELDKIREEMKTLHKAPGGA